MANKKKLLIATRNKGKLPEIVMELNDLPLEFLSLNDISNLAPDFEVEEPAMTFEGNAIIKAIMFGKKTGSTTLAEDAGLEVDALGGRPGVYSARYAIGTDRERCQKLLGELKDVPDEERGAQFHAVFAVYDPVTHKIRTCEGIYRGRIIREPKGSNGFGFDPIFYSDDLKKTYAEMTMEEKNSVSHRGRALNKVWEVLKNEFI